jgi:hypothetical protein
MGGRIRSPQFIDRMASGIRAGCGAVLAAHVLAHAREPFGVFLFDYQDRFEQPTRRGVVLTDVADDLAIGSA